MKAIELRKMSVEDLEKELVSLNHSLFTIRMQKGSGQKTATHKIPLTKRTIARIYTILKEKTGTKS